MKLTFHGGINENQSPSLAEANSGYNFELDPYSSKWVRRKPFDLKGTATNAAAINGIMQLITRANVETTLVQAGDTVYLWNGSSTFTSQGTVTSTSKLRDLYWSLGDYLLLTDISKTTVLKRWDGAALTTATTGLGGTPLYAKYGIVFQNRVWLFNVKTNTDTPHLMVASYFEDPTVFSITVRGGATTSGGGAFATGLEAFYMLSPDLKSINGVAAFFNTLVISTEQGKMFRLTGTSPSTYQWTEFYAGSAVISDEAIVNTGDDIIFMKKGGKIDFMSNVQAFGDVDTDDLTRYLTTTAKNLTAALIVYEQVTQKIYFFVANKVLVLFKNMIDPGNSAAPKFSPWSIYVTSDSSGFNTSAAKYMRIPGSTSLSTFWGDSVGRVFDMNGSGSGDAGATAVTSVRKTRLITRHEGRDVRSGKIGLDTRKKTLTGNVIYRRIGQVTLTLECDWQDEYNVSKSVVVLKGPPASDNASYWGGSGYFGGSFYWNAGFQFSSRVSSQSFSHAGKGEGFFLTQTVDGLPEFQIDSIEIEDATK